MSDGIILEEGVLRVPVLLSEGLESIITEDGLVGGELEELGISLVVGDSGEVAVVEGKPLLSPGGATGLANASLAILASNGSSVSELGLVSAEARAVLPCASQGVSSRESDNLHVPEAHAVEHLLEVTVGGGVLSRGGAASATVLAIVGSLSSRQNAG